MNPTEKADLLAQTFSGKYTLPEVIHNEFSGPLWPHDPDYSEIHVNDSRVHDLLKCLNEDSGTGPDGVSARVLKICAAELSTPFACLIRRIVSLNHWPKCWSIHWIMALYKRKSVFPPENYRGIHLTAQMSKAAERVLADFFVPRLEKLAFGRRQFAY